MRYMRYAIPVLAIIFSTATFAQDAVAPFSVANQDAAVKYLRLCYTAAKALPRSRINAETTCQSLKQDAVPDIVTETHVGYLKKSLTISAKFNDGMEILFDGTHASFNEPAHTTPQTRMRMRNRVVGCWTMDGLISRCCTEEGYCCTWIGKHSPICG